MSVRWPASHALAVPAALVLASALLIGVGPGPPGQSACRGWSVVRSPSPGTGTGPPTDDFLNAVAAVSPRLAWAVGYATDNQGITETLMLRWNGISWKRVPIPGELLFDVAASSARDAWAVGGSLIEHWDGTRWKQVPGGVGLRAVAALSATNAWAVGTTSVSDLAGGTVTEHWNGSRWKMVRSPSPGAGENVLASVAAISATNIWAVGYYNKAPGDPRITLIEHWDGTRWRRVSSPSPGAHGAQLVSVAGASPASVWAVGWYNGARPGAGFTLIEHWDVTRWKLIRSPDPTTSSTLGSVAVISAKNAWAVGSYGLPTTSEGRTLIAHWDGTRWKQVPSPNRGPGPGLNSVAATSPANIWAAGEYSIEIPTGQQWQTLILHRC